MSTVLVVVLVLLVLGVTGVGSLIFNSMGSPITPNAPAAAADVPPVGAIWFGRSFDPTTLAVRLRMTSVGTNESFVMVGHLPRQVDASGLTIRAYLDGQLVANSAANATGTSDVWGFNLGPLFTPGVWKYELADIGGNVLATGAITAT